MTGQVISRLWNNHMAGCKPQGAWGCAFMPGKSSMMLLLKSPENKWPCPECSDPVGGSAVICELDRLPCRTAENLFLELTLTQGNSLICVTRWLRCLSLCLMIHKNTWTFGFVFSCCGCCCCCVYQFYIKLTKISNLILSPICFISFILPAG